MKFLLFNLIVAGALVYLFGAGPVTNAVTDGVAVVAKITDKLVDKAKDIGGRGESAAPPAQAKPARKKVPKKVTAAPRSPAVVKPVVPAPAPAAQGAPERKAANLAPIIEAVDVRTLPVHAAPSPAITEAKAKAAKFMTPKQRWRELNRLAHDMELMYADKVTR